MVGLVLVGLIAAQTVAPTASPDTLPRPTAAQLAWHDLEIGMFVHFAPNTWQDREGDDLSTPLDAIDPTALDTDQWVDVASSMGARYIVFVAKHVGGFCWWPTDTTDYSVRNIAWRRGRGDVMADLSASCRRAGIGLGVYLSPADRHLGAGVGGRCDDPSRQAYYEMIYRRQLEELLVRYGPMMEVWFDGSLVFDVGDLLAEHAPDAVCFQGPHASIRWVGNEEGHAPYPAWNGARYDPATWGRLTARDGDPDGDRWLPNECDARIRDTWFWRTDNAGTLKSLDDLVAMYEASVGRGGVLLLNHAPDTTGRIPDADAARAAELGGEIRRRYGQAIASASGPGATREIAFSRPRRVDALVSMESIEHGERIRAYRIEGETDAGWTVLARGTAIGHKRIDRVDPVTVRGVRLVVESSVGEPQVRRFAAHDTRPPASVAGPADPNVILVVVDDMGWKDAACYGSRYYETPAMDRLAAEGTRFTQAYAAAAVCSPTRASIMTGRYPARLGITDWIRPLDGRRWTEQEIRAEPSHVGGRNRPLLTPRNPRWMERDEVTIAELLRARGYATGFVGKWHLGPRGYYPEDQGFDFNAGGCSLGHPPHFFDPYPATHQRVTFPNLRPRETGEYLTDREADEAVGFIRAHADRPFFLCLSHYAVHSPIQAKAEFVTHYRDKGAPEGDGQSFPKYAAMVHSVDEALAAVLAALDELELADRTIVIFTSDNGGATHFRATDNAPLRSGKGRPYEGGIRVPLLVRWPGAVRAGAEEATPVSTIDLLPTICAATGTDLPAERVIDGADLMPLLRSDGTLPRRDLFWHFPHYWYGGRQTPYSIVRAGDWKLIRWYETGSVELFDLGADPTEAADLATSRRHQAAMLDERLARWLDAVGGRLPRPNPAHEPASQ